VAEVRALRNTSIVLVRLSMGLSNENNISASSAVNKMLCNMNI
jgi:hypothetical protein